MIDFACPKINMDDLVRCSFNLNKTGEKIFKSLIKKKGFLKIKEISRQLNLDRTTVQKAMTELSKKDLIEKKQLNLKKGGYVYIYTLLDRDEIKKRMSFLLNNWHKEAAKNISIW